MLGSHHFFSHLTAARVWGCPLRAVSDETLHVSATHPARAPRRRGIVGHHADPASEIVMRGGFPTSDPIATWLAIASVVTLDELVVAADHLVLSIRVRSIRGTSGHSRLSRHYALRSTAFTGGERGVPHPLFIWCAREPNQGRRHCCGYCSSERGFPNPSQTAR